MSRGKTNRLTPDPWPLVTWLLVLAALLLVLTGTALDATEPPKELDRRARFAAQERYYEVVDRYGDTEGAVEAAKLVWEGYGHAED